MTMYALLEWALMSVCWNCGAQLNMLFFFFSFYFHLGITMNAIVLVAKTNMNCMQIDRIVACRDGPD